tara:strand:- start:3129 stop:4055 length:927 start_codon:yes stop_codon:yes gene_type:complete
MNLLYCLDENYNTQAFISILSFIKKSSLGLNIHIIHQEPATFEKYRKILSELNNSKIYLYRFENKNNVDLPIGLGDHISEATYYRIFIEQHLPKDLGEILYIDPDVVCLNNIEKIASYTFKEIKESGLTIAARTQGLKIHSEKLFNDLNIKASYFNAGVMFINLENWRSSNLTELLIKKLSEIKDIIVFWDQDVLNAHFDGNYLEIEENLNFSGNKSFDNKELPNILSQVYLIHYLGSKKPWKISGGITLLSNCYQDLHFEIFGKYHIIYDYKRKDLLHLITSIFSRKLFVLSHPFKYLKQAMFELIK